MAKGIHSVIDELPDMVLLEAALLGVTLSMADAVLFADVVRYQTGELPQRVKSALISAEKLEATA